MQLDHVSQALFDEIETIDPIVEQIAFGDVIRVKTNRAANYYALAKKLMPWRKGPFAIDDMNIDSEWRSDIKYNLIKNSLEIENKTVLDLGCNNGYYLFRMLEKKPKKLVGFDPSARCFLQFHFLNKFIKSSIEFQMLTSEDLEDFPAKFDAIVCLGVLYHRSDPIGTLRKISKSLKKGGELILDSLIIAGNEFIALCPENRYAKMPNVWFIPSVASLRSWLERTGFCELEIIGTRLTDASEQRKTEWIGGESLGDFLDANDGSRTVEGYPAPTRAYIRAKKR